MRARNDQYFKPLEQRDQILKSKKRTPLPMTSNLQHMILPTLF
jgi:hypothetical protein